MQQLLAACTNFPKTEVVYKNNQIPRDSKCVCVWSCGWVGQRERGRQTCMGARTMPVLGSIPLSCSNIPLLVSFVGPHHTHRPQGENKGDACFPLSLPHLSLSPSAMHARLRSVHPPVCLPDPLMTRQMDDLSLSPNLHQACHVNPLLFERSRFWHTLPQ